MERDFHACFDEVQISLKMLSIKTVLFLALTWARRVCTLWARRVCTLLGEDKSTAQQPDALSAGAFTRMPSCAPSYTPLIPSSQIIGLWAA